MEQWKEYKLSDILSIVSGFAYKGEYLGKGESLLLGMGCVSYSELFLEKGMRPYAGEFPERYSVEAGDIVLATRQQSDNLPILGMPAIVPQKFKGKKMVFGANLYKVVPKSPEFPIDYIYWLLKTPAYIRHIRSCQTGTTVRMITKANIEDYAFMCPCKEQRNQISKLLWDIEMKIVLNRRINDNLEQQAQALFKSWFVDFEPFKDGEFVDSELGMIPKGWRVVCLGEVTKQVTEKVGNREDVTVLSPVNSGELVLSEEYFTKQVFSKNLSKYLIVNPLSFAYNPARINIGSIGLNEYDFVGCVSPVYVVFKCEPNYHYFFDFYKRTAVFFMITTVEMTGFISGSRIWNSSRKCPQPSISAASSSSRLIPFI